MATANPTTPQSFTEQVREISKRAMCSELHDAIRGIKGIADALHPVFSELEEKEREALIVSIAPLATFAKSEIDSIFSDLDMLAAKMSVAEAGHE